ncbi:hypothetical protein TWF102_003878 [Orbilia oligospora]|uniref:Uncharacterized protein n=1 Tax=Orbilia oligospora TaxID=2813651 RepID=A0A7C8J8Y8_ORBOL|nr:hypothetical protein TWF102_003878 [Orbilia oligospora]
MGASKAGRPKRKGIEWEKLTKEEGPEVSGRSNGFVPNMVVVAEGVKKAKKPKLDVLKRAKSSSQVFMRREKKTGKCVVVTLLPGQCNRRQHSVSILPPLASVVAWLLGSLELN